MSIVLQNVLAIGLIVSCGFWATWQCIKSIRGKRSKLGSCCAKGCSAQTSPGENKVQFLPSDALRRKR